MQITPETLELKEDRKRAALAALDTRFSGKRVRQDSRKLAMIRKRDRRLRKLGHSILEFKS